MIYQVYFHVSDRVEIRKLISYQQKFYIFPKSIFVCILITDMTSNILTKIIKLQAQSWELQYAEPYLKIINKESVQL